VKWSCTGAGEGRSAGGGAECWWRGLVSAADFLTRGKVKLCNKLPYHRLGEVGRGVRGPWCSWVVVFVVGWWLVVVRCLSRWLPKPQIR
jgi:hypothetical protein